MSARHEIVILGRRAGLTTAEANQIAGQIYARMLREAAEDLRVSLARTVVGQSGDLDIVLDRLVDMADQADAAMGKSGGVA